jgi:epoxyqueuosine reductase
LILNKTLAFLEKNTKLIKDEAQRLGFAFCGISKAGFLEEDATLLDKWLKQGMHGQMTYMENYFDMRLDPTKLVPGAKSVISLLLNYYPEEKQEQSVDYKISKYAYGRDYHKVIKKKLKELHFYINKNIGLVEGRAFVDSAPVLDKAWARRSGLGWIGKHSNLINKQNGSFFFIAELIVDIELQYDNPLSKDYCGNCTKCIDACPTDAIVSPMVVNGSRCISYLTIELKDKIPKELTGKTEGWIFGCDICQDVCPWNRFSSPTQEFKPIPGLLDMKKRDWEEITEEIFNTVFNGSAIKRAKFEGLKRNILNVSLNKKGDS